MRIKCQKRAKTMEQHQNHTSTEGGGKSCRTVNRTRKHCCKNYKQSGIEWSLARERAFVPELHRYKCDNEDNDATQRNLNKRQFFGSTPKPSRVSKEFQNAFIAKILSPESALSRGCPTQRCLREKLSRGIRRPHSVLNLSSTRRLCQQRHLHLTMSHWKRVFFGSVSKSQLSRPRSSSFSRLLHSVVIGFIRIGARPLHRPRWPARIPRKN